MLDSSFSTDAIDRVSATRRPPDRVVMRQSWHDLLFLHWPVPAQQLRGLIPTELEIDTFAGHAYVGLVPFTMTGVRPVWAPRFPPLTDFHETNVRTYVHYRGSRPGVWFFSLDAANSLAVRIARCLWRLPYHFARMRLDRNDVPVSEGDSPQACLGTPAPRVRIDYRSTRLWPQPLPAECRVSYTASGLAKPATVGTLEHFLAERYILYTRYQDRIYSAMVHHKPYPLQIATLLSIEENMIAAAGIRHGDEPPLAHYARGVDVEVFPLRQINS